MRSLFLRIFLLFWIAMALVVALLVVTSPLFTRSRPGVERWRDDAERWAVTRLERVAEHIETRGVDGFDPTRGHGRGRGGGPRAPARIFVIDETGAETGGREVPEEVADIARRTLESGETERERTGMLYLVSVEARDPGGAVYAVVAAHHSPPRIVHLLEPEALAWRLGVLILVVGALSFWLSRYLTSPVKPLRRATRALSGGDLGARVEGKVADRRDEIGGLARDFDAMAERIEGLVGSQQRLLRDVSHELRSPLARLVVALELARSRAGAEAGGALDRIEREASRLDDLIGRLLLLERLEAGPLETDFADVDLGDLLAEVVEDAGFESAAEGIDVRLTSRGSCRVPGTPELLRSAFDNIVRNAVRYTEPGSAVEVGIDDQDDAVVVAVLDRGPGVADGELGRIFEPFFRVGEARDRADGGAGLGLAIAARAIRAHGGTVDAANHPDGGLVVTVRLPA